MRQKEDASRKFVTRFARSRQPRVSVHRFATTTIARDQNSRDMPAVQRAAHRRTQALGLPTAAIAGTGRPEAANISGDVSAVALLIVGQRIGMHTLG